MKRTKIHFIWALSMLAALLSTSIGALAQDAPKYPDLSGARGATGTKSVASAKLAADLRLLSDQFSSKRRGSKGSTGFQFSDEDLREMYGILAGNDDPRISIAVTTTSTADVDNLTRNGMKIFMRNGNTVYGTVAVRSLGELAANSSVVKIASTKSAKSPELPKSTAPPQLLADFEAASAKGARSSAAPAPFANEFNKSALSGKGVIVGVIDSGIDWKHPDFIRPDGTSRIIAIWDMFDDTFETSGGKIGAGGPKLAGGTETLPGTIYSNAQINAALKGSGTVNTLDNNGHGTAVAGTAAGNGRASAGKNAGVAPEADLIIVKASDCGGFTDNWVYGAAWITQFAKSLKRPLVVNGSFGGHFSAHDGQDGEELFLNGLTGKGIPGVVFTISAGNEGHWNMHGQSRFGPKRAGQADIQSAPITVSISQERTRGSNGMSMLLGLFDARDDWAVAVVPSATATALRDKNGKPMRFFLVKSEGEVKYATPEGLVPPDGFADLMNAIMQSSQLGTTTDFLTIPLPFGSYDIYGFSTSDKVANGTFDFYAPRYSQVDFGRGTTKTGMVGSPGNAANVITVGAYNFRPNWLNLNNTQTVFNLPMDRISDYSSPGGERADKVVKPDIAAPATFTISPLSQDAGPKSTSCGGDNMGAGSGEAFVTPDGKYIAWQGTSASSPFAAGVIALLLQKNQTLDAEQVRQILIKSARKGGGIGAVPNPQWGYGMLDPVAAIRATPLPSRKPTK